MPLLERKSDEYWDKLAQTYDSGINKIIGARSRRVVFDRVTQIKDLGETVEFGCGPGYFTRAIAQNASHVLATDLSNRMLDVAKENLKGLKNVSFQHVNCEATPFADSSFDTAFMANVVLILEHPEKAFGECHRVLRPGGRLILLYFTPHGMSIFDQFVFRIRFLNRFGLAPHVKLYSPEEMQAMLEKAGFTVEKMEYTGEKVKALFMICKK